MIVEQYIGQTGRKFRRRYEEQTDDICFWTDKYLLYISYNAEYRVFIVYTMLHKPSISDKLI